MTAYRNNYERLETDPNTKFNPPNVIRAVTDPSSSLRDLLTCYRIGIPHHVDSVPYTERKGSSDITITDLKGRKGVGK